MSEAAKHTPRRKTLSELVDEAAMDEVSNGIGACPHCKDYFGKCPYCHSPRPAPPRLHGPYGWLIMPEGLAEDAWYLADVPEAGVPSLPLYALAESTPLPADRKD